MADRTDDIKQLFSHLGLNPGDYQEIRNPAAAPKDASARAMPPSPAAATSQSAPSRHTEAAGPDQSDAPPTVALNIPPLPAQRRQVAPGNAPADEVSRRWPLLGAVQDNPPQVARIQAGQRFAERPPPQLAPWPAQPTPPVSERAQGEERPTQRLLHELREAPLEDTVERLSKAVQTQQTKARRQAPAAAAPASSAPPPAGAEVPRASAAAAPAHPGVWSGLSTTFSRLLQAGHQRQQAAGRLRLDLGPQGVVRATAEPQPETLSDIFQRLSQAAATTPGKSGGPR